MFIQNAVQTLYSALSAATTQATAVALVTLTKGGRFRQMSVDNSTNEDVFIVVGGQTGGSFTGASGQLWDVVRAGTFKILDAGSDDFWFTGTIYCYAPLAASMTSGDVTIGSLAAS